MRNLQCIVEVQGTEQGRNEFKDLALTLNTSDDFWCIIVVSASTRAKGSKPPWGTRACTGEPGAREPCAGQAHPYTGRLPRGGIKRGRQNLA